MPGPGAGPPGPPARTAVAKSCRHLLCVPAIDPHGRFAVGTWVLGVAVQHAVPHAGVKETWPVTPIATEANVIQHQSQALVPAGQAAFIPVGRGKGASKLPAAKVRPVKALALGDPALK